LLPPVGWVQFTRRLRHLQISTTFATRPEDIRRVFESGRYPYKRKMSRRTYEAEKARLQAELLKVQIWAQDTGQKFAMVFEGRDAAGKGGRSNALPST
jgi:polyphosphate kinase 2 (PPK2 family)